MARVRLATPADGVATSEIYAPYVRDAVTSFEVDPPTPSEMARRIETVLTWTPWLICEEAGAPIGYAYASKHRDRAAYQWSVDVAVYVAPTHHRRGVGRTLYEVLFPLLRLQGFYLAHAGITLPNPASIALHERLGFHPVGTYPAVGWKLGTWCDVGWWQLPLQPRPSTPEAPIPLPTAASLPGWAPTLARGDDVRLRGV